MIAPEQIILRPIITEKASFFKAQGGYVFAVAGQATKIDIRNAIETMFKVKVIDVNTVNVSGKKRMAGRKKGSTSGWKKAYVRLAGGQKIDLIEGMI